MNAGQQGHKCTKCGYRWWDIWCQTNPERCWKDENLCPSCTEITLVINGEQLPWKYVEDSFEAYVLNVCLGVHNDDVTGT